MTEDPAEQRFHLLRIRAGHEIDPIELKLFQQNSQQFPAHQNAVLLAGRPGRMKPVVPPSRPQQKEIAGLGNVGAIAASQQNFPGDHILQREKILPEPPLKTVSRKKSVVGGKTAQLRGQILPRVAHRLSFAVLAGPEDRTAFPDAHLKAGKLPFKKFDFGLAVNRPFLAGTPFFESRTSPGDDLVGFELVVSPSLSGGNQAIHRLHYHRLAGLAPGLDIRLGPDPRQNGIAVLIRARIYLLVGSL